VPRVRNALLVKAHHDHLARYSQQLEHEVRRRTIELEQSRLHVVYCLARAAEYRDDDTGRHVIRVGRYAAIIARELGMPPAYAAMLETAALLHDVGKIGIPDRIITKPDRLTTEEYEEIKRHPEIGARILQPVAFLADVVPCVRHHHEWYDGSTSGYPARLVGDQIPLPSRIILVSDTLEAMTSDRPYRKGMALERVLEELRRFSGTQFDPLCVDAMLRLLEREGDAFLSRDRTFDIHAFLEV
jgi:putative two-component system response regulator